LRKNAQIRGGAGCALLDVLGRFSATCQKTIRPGIVTILGADENKDVRPSVGVQILPLAADEMFLADSPRRPGAGQRPDAHFSTGERDARGEGYACGFS
jgi:hypothetical protein